MRQRVLLVLLWVLTIPAWAQSPTGTINGRILDPTKAVIPGATVEAVNVDTNVRRTTETNDQGLFTIGNLPPGNYRIEVSKQDFKRIVKPGVTLHVQDVIALNFDMSLGSASESVTVQGGEPLVNSESGSVGTVVSHQFIENLPLNGRNFNGLLQLTPGVVIARGSGGSAPGQFSVNGQRTDANNFSIDGASVNFGINSTSAIGQTGTGSSQAFNAFGGTSSLVSVDAVQEFRIQTSSFSPEYGRSPGAQVVISTRSGTNQFHGAMFDYVRNDAFDANDWFANHQSLRKAALRQNDFGGFLGGPLVRNKTFFFASYEGLRFHLPQTAVDPVPSLSIRASAPAGIAELLSAYPLPNGPALSSETAQFTANYSDANSLDAMSLRLDHFLTSAVSIFGRYSYSSSQVQARQADPSVINRTRVPTQTATLGSNLQLKPNLVAEIRLNYSRQSGETRARLDSFGGAVPFPIALVLPTPLSEDDSFAFFLLGSTLPSSISVGRLASNTVDQFNLVGSITATAKTHQIKAGIDYRDMFLLKRGFNGNPNYNNFGTLKTLSSGSFSAATIARFQRADALFKAFSVYAQDSWSALNRLTVTYGLRWELNPAPTGRDGTILRTFDNLDDPTRLAIAPPGTPLWKATYSDFAPRLGAAYRLTPTGNVVVRGGAGLFYDLGAGTAGNAVRNPPFEVSTALPAKFPTNNLGALLPAFTTNPPYGTIFGFSRNLQLPRSWQWNGAIEQAFGERQSLSLTYVGQAGRRLLNTDAQFRPSPLVSSGLFVTRNSAKSSYNALQVQFRRSLSSALEAIANYTWSHSIDSVSGDQVQGFPQTVLSIESERGPSDFDVRHNFTSAVSWNLPKLQNKGILSAIANGWSLDGLISSRTAMPVNVQTTRVMLSPTIPVTLRPDLVPGMPFYISDPTSPGGKRLNPLAFAVQSQKRQGTLGRNVVPGFGATQIDLSMGRKFPVTERTALLFKTDLFNVLNHPNFANPNSLFNPTPGTGNGSVPPAGLGLFGTATQMLNRGLGGLNPLYQIGGPRSIQFSLRLTF